MLQTATSPALPQAIQATQTTLATLATTMAAGLATGTALGAWAGRRLRPTQADADHQEQLQALTRAKEASELANVELLQALQDLEQAAGTDRLTGAWNRRRFEDGAARLVALSGRRGDAFSLIFFDLDHFKRVNDTFGHDIGDAVLKQVVATVQTQLRGWDRRFFQHLAQVH